MVAGVTRQQRAGLMARHDARILRRSLQERPRWSVPRSGRWELLNPAIRYRHRGQLRQVPTGRRVDDVRAVPRPGQGIEDERRPDEPRRTAVSAHDPNAALTAAVGDKRNLLTVG